MINRYFNKKDISYNYHNNKPDNYSNRIVYWGEVISTADEYEGGRIKVRIPELDNKIKDDSLPYSYPLLPKFFHVYPKIGEIVRIILEDPEHPQRGRLWMGSIISQLQNIEYDGIYTALSTTHLGVTQPESSLKSYPEAEDVFPDKDDVALIGRKNADIVLKKNSIEIRVGKHIDGNVYKKNKKNPSFIKMFFNNKKGNDIISENILMSDKIAILTHDGTPKFRNYDLNNKYKDDIFKNAHPIARGDILVNILEIIRNTIIQHIHPYNGVSADNSGSIIDLKKIDFESILQRNFVTN